MQTSNLNNSFFNYVIYLPVVFGSFVSYFTLLVNYGFVIFLLLVLIFLRPTVSLYYFPRFFFQIVSTSSDCYQFVISEYNHFSLVHYN